MLPSGFPARGDRGVGRLAAFYLYCAMPIGGEPIEARSLPRTRKALHACWYDNAVVCTAIMLPRFPLLCGTAVLLEAPGRGFRRLRFCCQ